MFRWLTLTGKFAGEIPAVDVLFEDHEGFVVAFEDGGARPGDSSQRMRFIGRTVDCWAFQFASLAIIVALNFAARDEAKRHP